MGKGQNMVGQRSGALGVLRSGPHGSKPRTPMRSFREVMVLIRKGRGRNRQRLRQAGAGHGFEICRASVPTAVTPVLIEARPGLCILILLYLVSHGITGRPWDCFRYAWFSDIDRLG